MDKNKIREMALTAIGGFLILPAVITVFGHFSTSTGNVWQIGAYPGILALAGAYLLVNASK